MAMAQKISEISMRVSHLALMSQGEPAQKPSSADGEIEMMQYEMDLWSQTKEDYRLKMAAHRRRYKKLKARRSKLEAEMALAYTGKALPSTGSQQHKDLEVIKGLEKRLKHMKKEKAAFVREFNDKECMNEEGVDWFLDMWRTERNDDEIAKAQKGPLSEALQQWSIYVNIADIQLIKGLEISELDIADFKSALLHFTKIPGYDGYEHSDDMTPFADTHPLTRLFATVREGLSIAETA